MSDDRRSCEKVARALARSGTPARALDTGAGWFNVEAHDQAGRRWLFGTADEVWVAVLTAPEDRAIDPMEPLGEPVPLPVSDQEGPAAVAGAIRAFLADPDAHVRRLEQQQYLDEADPDDG